MTRVAEVNAFFEEEKLDTAGDGRTPVLTELELADLPTSHFEVTEDQDDEDTFFKCTICQQDFEDGVRIRTMRCLHMFHKECIDRWLTKQNGSCPVCKIVQKAPTHNLSPTSLATRNNNLQELMRRNRTEEAARVENAAANTNTDANNGSAAY